MGHLYIPGEKTISGPWLLDIEEIEELHEIFEFVDSKISESIDRDNTEEAEEDVKRGYSKSFEDAKSAIVKRKGERHKRVNFGAYLAVILLFIAFTFMTACTKKRTPDETKKLLIGRWETVTEMQLEMPFVFTDSTLKTDEEFGFNGRYMISDLDSLTVFDFHGDVTFKVRFPESETTMILTANGWDPIRLEKILDKK
jgi:hypothetical protein